MTKLFQTALLVGLTIAPLFSRSIPAIALPEPTSQTAPSSIAKTQFSPERWIDRLFTAPELQADWFAPEFLTAISLPDLQAVIDSLENALGRYQSVRVEDEGYRVQFEFGSVPTQIRVDDRGPISALFFAPPHVTPEQAIARLQSLPGQTSLLILEDNTERAALNADDELAVGSAFKLAVLLALKQQITAGDRTWDEVVPLQPDWKTLPTGILQTWADGSPLTLQTLATLMISISDNTATNGLMDLVGRAAIEALSPRNSPFLNTREAAVLKAPENADLLAQYRTGDDAQRRTVLEETARRPLPGVEIFDGNPIALDVEWFFSTRQLCEIAAQVADLPAMHANPGTANPQDWSQIAFKGGSEPGAIDLTTHLVGKNGKTYCISATWNNPNAVLDEMSFTTLYGGVIMNQSSVISHQSSVN